MGELGHVNIVIRAREQGVDCFIDENRELEVSCIPNSVSFCCYREKNV